MIITIDHRAPVAALRRGVFGFLAGVVLGGLFVGAVLLLGIGNIAALAAQAGGLSLRELGILPVTFGLIGLVAAPALGTALGEDPA